VRIALVGPTHPFKGGVAAHTTELAHRLAAAGHVVDLVSWDRLYPKLLYPGEQVVPGGGPDLPPYPGTVRPLRWDRPGTWWRTGRQLRTADLVVVVVVIPAQAPALLTLIRALGRRPSRPRVVVLAHNVVPHETHPGGAWLTERVLRAADGVMVHSADLARQAREHGARQVRWAGLPPHLPGGPPEAGRDQPGGPPEAGRDQPGGPPEAGLRVLALGMVRHYKGFDLLLQAARVVPGVRVTVAGEQWGRAGERVRELAADPALVDRVRLLRGYVPGDQVPGLLRGHDVLALPYRDATGSQNVLLAHAYGLPVLATRVGSFPEQVRDGSDGLLVPPGDVDALVAALRRLTDPGTLAGLRAGVPPVDLDTPWRDYLAALTATGSAPLREAS
jgi:glycosyltransferase involved in cell wall biosynthesis